MLNSLWWGSVGMCVVMLLLVSFDIVAVLFQFSCINARQTKSADRITGMHPTCIAPNIRLALGVSPPGHGAQRYSK